MEKPLNSEDQVKHYAQQRGLLVAKLLDQGFDPEERILVIIGRKLTVFASFGRNSFTIKRMAEAGAAAFNLDSVEGGKALIDDIIAGESAAK